MSNAIEANPLIGWTDIPPYADVKPEDIDPAVNYLLENAESNLQALEKLETIDWDSLIPELEKTVDQVSITWNIVGHLNAVKNSDALREAYSANQPKMVTFSNRQGQSRPIYDAMLSLRESDAWNEYEPAQQRVVSNYIRSAKLAGVGLDGADKERFNEIATRLAKLSTQFSNNVLDATKRFKLTLTEAAEIEGLPASFLELLAQKAVEAGHDGATGESGPWVVGLDSPSVIPFWKYSKRRDLRETLYRAHVSRATEGDLDNKPIVDEILALRKEQATLLGFESFAHLSLDRKMAENPDAVFKLLNELKSASQSASAKDVNMLKAHAAEQGDPAGELFMPWDTYFWSERVREAKFDLNDEEIKPYFSLPRVLQAMFDLVEKLFDIHITQVKDQIPVWHKDVTYYLVKDGDGEQIASFFLDPYARPAEKRGGAWMNTLYGRSDTLAPVNADVRLPVAYMVCNQSPPVGDAPSLMTFTEVTTLFHEFGHALQHMLTHINHGFVAGISGVEWDAVEIASQFMENWLFHKPLLKAMAIHYETGEPLPDALIDKMQAARTFQAGYALARQLTFGMFDMTLHTKYDPEQSSVHELQLEVMADTSAIMPIEEDYFYCGFMHIFSSSYAAGYYSYKWAEVLSADAFAAFEEVGLDNDEAVRELGQLYRETILGRGGSQHPMDVFKAFRKREPSVEALLRHNGFVD